MITRRKIHYPVSQALRQYLYHFDRQRDIPRIYNDLSRFSGAIPYEDPRSPQEWKRELQAEGQAIVGLPVMPEPD